MTSSRQRRGSVIPGPDVLNDLDAFSQALDRMERPAEGVDLVPDDAHEHAARIRRALVLAMAGKTQQEIGTALGAAPRTVRRWLAEARERRLVAFHGPTPEQVVARATFVQDQLEAVLLDRLEQVRGGDDTAALVRCVRELRGLQRDRAWLLKATGYFRQVQFAEPPKPRDRASLEAMQIRAFAYTVLHGSEMLEGEQRGSSADEASR